MSKFPSFLLAASLLLSACNTVSTQANTVVEDTTDTIESSWLELANNTNSIDVFMTAANNIILLEDTESYQRITREDLIFQRYSAATAQVGRNRVATLNRMKIFIDYLGGVCGNFTENDWSLQRTRVADDRESGFMDYRIESDDSNSWCTLTIARVDGTFKITNWFNHYFNVDLDDMVRDFYELDSNEGLDFPLNRITRSKSIYTEMEKGLAAFDAYLRQASADPSLPLVNRIRLELIDQLTDLEIQKSALTYFVKPYGLSSAFPIQQLLLDLESPLDEPRLAQSIANAEKITGERSTMKTVAASFLRKRQQTELAKTYLDAALIAEPTNTETYFSLFDWCLHQQNFSAAVQLLKVMEENFGYTFERDDFMDNERYADLITQPVFNDWLPKG